MTNYTSSNKTVSNKISEKDNTPSNAYRIIKSCSLSILETSQGILPNPPNFIHKMSQVPKL